MPKRCSVGRDGGRTAKRRPQHLYLVLDDWVWGYSIRRIDLSPDTDSDESPQQLKGAEFRRSAELRLPPAIFRLEAPTGFPNYFVAAFGTKIIAMSPPDVMRERDTHPLPPSCGAVSVFDVQTRLFGFAPGPEPEVNLEDPIYFSLDQGLFVVSSSSFKMLRLSSQGEPGCPCWEWCDLPKHPFNSIKANCYGAHPDGRTIFVSTRAATFTFDPVKPHSKWKRHRKWTLPFTGRTYFDGELDTWIGLHRKNINTTGHLCSCDFALYNRRGSPKGQGPTWKISKETLFSEDPVEVDVGATLVYMGGRSKYCLVQCVSIDDGNAECLDEERSFYKVPNERVVDEWGDPIETCRFLFRLTTFSLKFDKDGQLTTGNSRRVRYYKAPEAPTLRYPVALWM